MDGPVVYGSANYGYVLGLCLYVFVATWLEVLMNCLCLYGSVRDGTWYRLLNRLVYMCSELKVMISE